MFPIPHGKYHLSIHKYTKCGTRGRDTTLTVVCHIIIPNISKKSKTKDYLRQLWFRGNASNHILRDKTWGSPCVSWRICSGRSQSTHHQCWCWWLGSLWTLFIILHRQRSECIWSQDARQILASFLDSVFYSIGFQQLFVHVKIKIAKLIVINQPCVFVIGVPKLVGVHSIDGIKCLIIWSIQRSESEIRDVSWRGDSPWVKNDVHPPSTWGNGNNFCYLACFLMNNCMGGHIRFRWYFVGWSPMVSIFGLSIWCVDEPT